MPSEDEYSELRDSGDTWTFFLFLDGVVLVDPEYVQEGKKGMQRVLIDKILFCNCIIFLASLFFCFFYYFIVAWSVILVL